MSLTYDFSGKTVLVTGGSRGIGLDLVKALAECGARVISLSRTVGELEALKQENAHYSIDIIKCDISNWAELETVGKSLPVVDCLVNNAAKAIISPFGKLTLQEIDATFDTNVKAIINLSQIVTNTWKSKQIKGVVVNVSSQASQRAINHHTVYSAAKASVDSLTRSMALELGPYGIRVNAVNPTAILTEMGKLYWDDEKSAQLKSRMPLGRLGEVSEVVDVIMYLLTDRCSLVTGAIVPIDGGFWAT